MIQAYWNSLRVHDEVFVHDDDDEGFAISPGTIAFVSTHPGGPNTLTVRLTALDGTTPLVHPKRLAVHLHRPEHGSGCWRCDVGETSPSVAPLSSSSVEAAPMK